MKITRLIVLLTALTLVGPATALAQMALKGNQLSYKAGAERKTLRLEEGAVTKVQGSKLVFVLVADPEALAAADAGSPGLFFFDQNGALTARFAGGELFDPEMCAAASLSPDGRTIALDNGTWVVRAWTFYRFPDFTPLGPADGPFLTYLTLEETGGQDLTWVDDQTVVVTDLNATQISRPCPADPCEPLDVVLHRLDSWESTALAKGDELCDYRFKSLSGRTVTVEKTCVKKLEDWENIDQANGRKTASSVTVEIPAARNAIPCDECRRQ